MDVEPVAVTGWWWRHLPAGGDPLWRPHEPADGRWQRGSVVEAVYFADDPATAWAEWYRALAEAGLPPHRSLPRDLWRAEVALDVADLSDRDRLRRVGLDVPRPVRAEWPAFQDVGEQLQADGWLGLLALSAARPEHCVLCVFRTEDQLPRVTFAPPSQRIDQPPAPPRGMTT